MFTTDSSRLRRSETLYRVSARVNEGERQGEQGFLLLGLVVAIFLILLVLGVAAPRVAHELRREREVETVHRGNQYVRALQVYYAKMGGYPGSMEQLEKANNVRFLRKRYIDPLTGKDDWRVIPVGQAKTTVKGFFGKPLAGIASSGLGANAGSASPGGVGTPVGGTSSPSAFGTPSSGGTGGLGTSGSSGSSFGSSGSSFGSSSGSSFGSSGSSFGSSGSSFGSSSGSSFGTPGSSSPGSSSGETGSSSGIGSQSATTFTGSTGPFVGVGLVKDGNSIMTLNEQTTYPTWEFIYDPRIEQLKARVSLFGGGMATADATSFGSSSGPASGPGGLNSGSNPGTGTQPSSGSSGSGSFGGGSFGSGSSGSGSFGGGGFGSGTGSGPTTSPQQPQ